MSTRAVSPVGGQRPFIMRKGISKVEDLADGHVAMNAAMVGAKTVYYCEGNAGNDNNSGVGGWENAFKTLAVAFAASHADIASNKYGWAARNVILIRGDRFTETITVFPQKTDVIGLGSCDALKRAGIRGNHAPVNTYYGTRFFNVEFEPAASGDIMTLTASGSGAEFHNCQFIGVWGSYTAPSAIDVTAHPQFAVENCVFLGGFSGDVIDVGAGDASGMRIVGNDIVGAADNGIVITGVATVAGFESRGLIKENFIQAADKALDTRATSVYNVYGNRMISGEAVGSSSYVIDLTFAVDNILTGNDVSVRIPTTTDIST